MPTEQQIMDWADALALDIISMVYGRSIGDARRAVAKELRSMLPRRDPRTYCSGDGAVGGKVVSIEIVKDRG